MESPLAAETRQGAEGGTPLETQALGFLQQPLVGQQVVVAAILRYVEFEKTAVHGSCLSEG